MAKRQHTGVLNRFAGKKLVFNGKFGYGVEASLKALAEAQKGTVRDDLDEKAHYLVLADLSAGKTIQKKVMSLNGKGAAIQVIDADAFTKLAEPTDEEILALLRGGESEIFAKIYRWTGRRNQVNAKPAKTRFHSETLRGLKLFGVDFDDIEFSDCDFVSAEFDRVHLGSATHCDFSKITGERNCFGDVQGSRFANATLKQPRFEGHFSGADFTGALLDDASFSDGAILISPEENRTGRSGVHQIEVEIG